MLPQLLAHSRPGLRERLAGYAGDDLVVAAVPLAVVENVGNLEAQGLLAVEELERDVLSGDARVGEVARLDERLAGAPTQPTGRRRRRPWVSLPSPPGVVAVRARVDRLRRVQSIPLCHRPMTAGRGALKADGKAGASRQSTRSCRRRPRLSRSRGPFESAFWDPIPMGREGRVESRRSGFRPLEPSSMGR